MMVNFTQANQEKNERKKERKEGRKKKQPGMEKMKEMS